MDPVAILADVQLAVKLAKMAYDLEQDIAPYMITAYEIMFKNKVLTAAERQTLTDKEAAMRASIDAKIVEDDAATD